MSTNEMVQALNNTPGRPATKVEEDLAGQLLEALERAAAAERQLLNLETELVEQRCLAAAILRIRCCHSCGCTDTQPCEEGCWWMTDDLCSACAEKRGLDLHDPPEVTDPVRVRLRDAVQALEAIERGEDRSRILREWRSTLEESPDA